MTGHEPTIEGGAVPLPRHGSEQLEPPPPAASEVPPVPPLPDGTIEGGAVPLPEDRDRAFDDWWSRVFFTGGGAEASAREAFRAGWDAGQPHRAAVPLDDDEDYSLTYEQAVAMLPDGEQVHTILDGDIALIGADWDRADVLALLRDGRPEVSGQQAAASGHGMVAFPPLGPVFIATRPAEGPAA